MSTANDDARDYYATELYYKNRIQILEENVKAAYAQGAADYKQQLMDDLVNYWVAMNNRMSKVPAKERDISYAVLNGIDLVISHLKGVVDMSKVTDVRSE